MSLLEASLLAAARQRPDAPLLHIGPRTLTGRDFEALVDSTAQQWQRQGLGAGTLIGWLGHNSPEMLAALLACARLGAVFVPLNWRLGLVARADRERYPVDQRLRFTDTAGRASSAYRAQTQEAARDEALTATPQWQWDAADGRLAQLNAVLSVSQYVGAGDDLRSELQGSPPRLQADRLAYQHQRGFGQMGFKAAWPLADGTRLGASLLASRGRRVQHSVLTGSDLGGAAVRDSAVQSTRIDDVISARGDLQRRLAAEHTVTAGLQLEGNRRQENRVQQERIASWAPDLTDEHYDAASSSLAAFVQDDWLASKATTLSAGVRVEQLQTRSEGNVFDAVRNTYQLASPMLNLLWRPDPGSQWKLGLSRAFRLPEPRDIMPRRWTRPENSSLVPDFVGNPALRPESAWTASAGWDHRLGAEDGAASLGLTGVLKRVADIMLDELVLQDGQYLLRRANFGAAWVGSLQAQWQGELAAPWGGPVKLLVGVAARASRLDALPGPDNRLAGQAPWDLRLEADHPPAGSRWAYTAAWRWRAASVAQAPSARRLGTGQTHSLDLAAVWQQGPASRWRVSVTGLGAPEVLDSVVRQWQGGTDSASASTQVAPRWRAQWLHKF